MKARRVSRLVGLNPIAQAVFRAQFAKDLVTKKISILMMEQGEDCVTLLQELAFVLAVVGRACELEARNDPEARIVRGGMGAVLQMSKQKAVWDISQAAGLVRALEATEGLVRVLRPSNISLAVHSVVAGEIEEIALN